MSLIQEVPVNLYDTFLYKSKLLILWPIANATEGSLTTSAVTEASKVQVRT